METYSDLSVGELLASHTQNDILKMSKLEFAQYEQLDSIKNLVESMNEFLALHPEQGEEFAALRDMEAEFAAMFSG